VTDKGYLSDEHFLKYQNLVRKCSWDWIRRNPNLDFDELVGEGNLAYTEALMTWNENKGCFATHLWWNLRHRLGRENSKKIDDDNYLTELDEALGIPDLDDPIESCSFMSGLHCLSSEAKEIVNLILGSSGELCDFTMATVKVIQGNIRKYMRSREWPHRKIDRTMKEIKEMLRNL
jgi:hypothetical protein